MGIKFTQYMLPNGEQREIIMRAPDEETTQKANWLRFLKQCYFEVEILTTGEVAMYCHQKGEDDPVSMRICQNNEEVIDNTKSMISEAYELLFEEE